MPPTDADGSVTGWIDLLRDGDPAAAQPLWERYFARLVALARARLRRAPRVGLVEDGEDAALSAFDSFCRGAAAGRFPLLSDRDDLWRLLVVLTARKAADQLRRRGRLKRGGGAVAGESDLPGGDDGPGGLDRQVGPEPTPEFAAMVVEQYRRLLEVLGDETLRAIALWRLEGLSHAQIAARLGCSLRTVANKLTLIRRIWQEEAP